MTAAQTRRQRWYAGAALCVVLALAGANPAMAEPEPPSEIPLERPPAATPPAEPRPASNREDGNAGDELRSNAEEGAATGTTAVPGQTRERVPRPSRDLTNQIRTVGEGEDGGTPPPGPGLVSAPPQPPAPVCQPAKVASGDDFIELLRQGAAAGGFAPGSGSPDPRDAQTELRWNVAMAREQAVQERMMRDLADLQAEIAGPLNAYLSATDRWQSSYVNVTSSSTALQGMLTEWLEARKVYERADLAFALANLGVGVGKLGFKGFRWIQARRAAGAEASAATSAAGTGTTASTRAADARRALENTPLAERYAPVAGVSEAGSTYRAAAQSGISGELAVAEATQNWATQLRRLERSYDKARESGAPAEVLERLRAGLDTLRQGRPGAYVPQAAAGGANAVQDAAALAAARARYAEDLVQTERMLADATKNGDQFLQREFGEALAQLRSAGPPTSVVRAPTAIESATSQVGGKTLELARQYGVDPRPAIQRLAAGQIDEASSIAAEMEVLAQVARAKGWHQMPRAVDDLLHATIIQGRRVLAGVEGAQIAPSTVAALRRLQAALAQRRIGLGRYLDNAAETMGGVGALELEGIALRFAKSDVDLILKILETGGNAARLRGSVGQVTLASLSGLARGTTGLLTGNCVTAGEGLLRLNTVAGSASGLPILLAPGQPSPPPPTLALTDQQLANVLDGTGELGNVGLANVVDQFGITDRFTQGQGLGRAVLGEMWELLTSPSATTASFYYTFEAQKAYIDLLTTAGPRIVELGVALDDAARALRELETVLNRADAGRYLDTRGPDELKQALEDLQRAYDSGSTDWKNRNRAGIEGRKAHITQKLADLDETRGDMRTLAGRMTQLRAWLDAVRLGPDGKPRPPVEAFNPLTFVRLGSIDRYLRAMGADTFGLVAGTPIRMVLTEPDPDASFEAERKRFEERARALDAAPDVDIDPGLDEWLKAQENR